GLPVVNAAGQIALYSDPTNERYVHGILGDDLEAAALLVLQISPENLVETVGRIALTGDEVFEGLLPMWADVDGDEIEDLIVTVSSGRNGAGVRVFSIGGNVIAAG